MNFAGTIRMNNQAIVILSLGLTVLYLIYSWNNPRNQTSSFPHASSQVNVGDLLCTAISAAEAGGREVKLVREKSKSELNEKSKGKTKEGVNDVLTDGDLRSHVQMYGILTAKFPGVKVISEEHTENKTHHENPIIKHDCPAHLPKEKFLPSESLTVWIDPLDATKEYTENLLQYVTTMVCVAYKGDPIIGVIHKPFEGKTYWAWVDHGISEDLSDFKETMEAKKESFIVSRSHTGEVEKLIYSKFSEAKITQAGGAGYKALEVAAHHVGAYVHLTNIKKWDVCAGHAVLSAMGGQIKTLRDEVIKYDSTDPVLIENGLVASLHKEHYSKLIQS